jgi:hypothetical protein
VLKSQKGRRRAIPTKIVIQVLTEAGYRCAVPTCRNILAIDLHHMVEVSEGGGSEPGNLIALCPTCHALFHRGTIARDSIYAWKMMLVSLSNAFDVPTIDDLLFLGTPEAQKLQVSGDGVLKFSRLIGAGLATLQSQRFVPSGSLQVVVLTQRGRQLIEAWKSGSRQAVTEVLSAIPGEPAR